MKAKKTQKQIESQIDEAVAEFYPKYIELLKERQEYLENRTEMGHTIAYNIESVEDTAIRVFSQT